MTFEKIISKQKIFVILIELPNESAIKQNPK